MSISSVLVTSRTASSWNTESIALMLFRICPFTLSLHRRNALYARLATLRSGKPQNNSSICSGVFSDRMSYILPIVFTVSFGLSITYSDTALRMIAAFVTKYVSFPFPALSATASANIFATRLLFPIHATQFQLSELSRLTRLNIRTLYPLFCKKTAVSSTSSPLGSVITRLSLRFAACMIEFRTTALVFNVPGAPITRTFLFSLLLMISSIPQLSRLTFSSNSLSEGTLSTLPSSCPSIMPSCSPTSFISKTLPTSSFRIRDDVPYVPSSATVKFLSSLYPVSCFILGLIP